MKFTLSVLFALLLSGCSLQRSHVNEVQENQEGDEYSIYEYSQGFIVAGHYSEYQFVRSSEDGFIGCNKLISAAAKLHVEPLNKLVVYPTWREITIVDHGRDLLSAIMNVNCQYNFMYVDDNHSFSKSEKLNEVSELYSKDILTDKEYKIARTTILTQ